MNKKTAITGFILTIIIIGVILAIYFGTRKTNDPEKEPIISISSAELAAQSETETETYKMMTEYYDLPELSKGVEIKTTINVKDSYLIKTLKITRTNGSNVDEQNVPISDGDKTISFRPKPNENMAVTHTIKVTYTTLVSDTVKDGPSATIAISEDQLSLASTSKSGDVSLTVGNPSLSNNVLFTKNYVTIKLGSIDIFPSQKIYFSPASGNGFKIMGASGNSLNVVNGKIFYILAAGNKNMIATTATETTATEYLTYTNNTLSLSIKTINIQNKLFDITFGGAVQVVPKPYTYYEEENPSWSTCGADLSALITHCKNSTNCGAIGRQSNGCWHMFKGDSLPNDSDTAFYAKYGTVLEKKNDFKLFYGGDGALGRDGRNACNMTDADKQDACIRDDKLQIIGSGGSCGHKYYNTDKGMGSKLPTDYTNIHFCNREYGIEYGLISPNTGHNWHASGLTPEECRVKAVANGDNAYGMSTPTHPDVIAGKNKVSCWSRKIPGVGSDTFTGLVTTGEGGNLDHHIAGCTTIGKKVSNNCV